jgi:hypothetical protein
MKSIEISNGACWLCAKKSDLNLYKINFANTREPHKSQLDYAISHHQHYIKILIYRVLLFNVAIVIQRTPGHIDMLIDLKSTPSSLLLSSSAPPTFAEHTQTRQWILLQ